MVEQLLKVFKAGPELGEYVWLLQLRPVIQAIFTESRISRFKVAPAVYNQIFRLSWRFHASRRRYWLVKYFDPKLPQPYCFSTALTSFLCNESLDSRINERYLSTFLLRRRLSHTYLGWERDKKCVHGGKGCLRLCWNHSRLIELPIVASILSWFYLATVYYG